MRSRYSPPERGFQVVVAASDATDKAKRVADYVCDGTADQEEIQAAIDATASTGGQVRLSAGNFAISAAIEMTHAVGLIGSGDNASILRAIDDIEDNVVEYCPTTAGGFANLRDLEIIGHAEGTVGHGIYMCDDGEAPPVGDPRDWTIDRVYIRECAQDGIHITANWGGKITNCISETNEGKGAYLTGGTQTFVKGSFFAYNKGDYGVQIATPDCQFLHNYVFRNEKSGMYVAGDNNVLVGNKFLSNGCETASTTNTHSNLILWASATYGTVIVGNNFNGVYGGKNTKYDIYINQAVNNIITGNSFETIGTTHIYDPLGTGQIIGNNVGADDTVKASVAISPAGKTSIDTTNGALALSLKDGTTLGQFCEIVMTVDGGHDATLTIAHHATDDAETATFADVDDRLILQWEGTHWNTWQNTGVVFP